MLLPFSILLASLFLMKVALNGKATKSVNTYFWRSSQAVSVLSVLVSVIAFFTSNKVIQIAMFIIFALATILTLSAREASVLDHHEEQNGSNQ